MIGSPEAAEIAGVDRVSLTNAVLRGVIPAPESYRPRVLRGGRVDHQIAWSPHDVAAVWALARLGMIQAGTANLRWTHRRRAIVSVWDTVHDWDFSEGMILAVVESDAVIMPLDQVRDVVGEARRRRSVVKMLGLDELLARL